jgi:hypothetical protein
MSDVIVSQDIDNFMQSVNATNALRLLSGFPISGGTVKGNIAVSGNVTISNELHLVGEGVTLNVTGESSLEGNVTLQDRLIWNKFGTNEPGIGTSLLPNQSDGQIVLYGPTYFDYIVGGGASPYTIFVNGYTITGTLSTQSLTANKY